MGELAPFSAADILKPAAADPDLDDDTRRNFKNMSPAQKAFFQKLVDLSQSPSGDGVAGVYIHSNSEDASTIDTLLSEGYAAVFTPNAIAHHEVLPDNMFGNILVVKIKTGVYSSNQPISSDEFAERIENLRTNSALFNSVQERTQDDIPAWDILIGTSADKGVLHDKCAWTAQLGPANSWIGIYRRKSKHRGVHKFAIVAHVVHPRLGQDFKRWMATVTKVSRPTVLDIVNSNTHRLFRNLAYRNAARLVYKFAETANLGVKHQYDYSAYLADARMDRPLLAIPHFHTEYGHFEKHHMDNSSVVLFLNKTAYLAPGTRGHVVMLSPLEGVLVYSIRDRLSPNKHGMTVENSLVACTAPVCMGRKKSKMDVLADGSTELPTESYVSSRVRKFVTWANPDDRHAGSRAYDVSYKEVTPNKLEMFSRVLALPDKYHHYKPCKVRVTAV